jgi:disease resistance protein RPM1
LKKLQLYGLPRLKNIPTGIQHLEKLEVLLIRSMQVEYLQHKSPEDWNWIMEHVPFVEISTSDGNIVPDS